LSDARGRDKPHGSGAVEPSLSVIIIVNLVCASSPSIGYLFQLLLVS
jgi:hypothetical protein